MTKEVKAKKPAKAVTDSHQLIAAETAPMSIEEVFSEPDLTSDLEEYIKSSYQVVESHSSNEEIFGYPYNQLITNKKYAIRLAGTVEENKENVERINKRIKQLLPVRGSVLQVRRMPEFSYDGETNHGMFSMRIGFPQYQPNAKLSIIHTREGVVPLDIAGVTRMKFFED